MALLVLVSEKFSSFVCLWFFVFWVLFFVWLLLFGLFVLGLGCFIGVL